MTNTVSSSLTSAVAGKTLAAGAGESTTYDLSGTFVGTAIVERSRNRGASWEQVAGPFTDAESGVLINETPLAVDYRFRCTAFTSGTLVGALADVNDQQKLDTDKYGKSEIEHDDNDVKFDKTIIGTLQGGVTTADTGTVTALMLQQAAADLGNADVTVVLSNSHSGKVTNVTTDGTITAGAFAGPLTGNVTGDVSGSAGTATTSAALTGAADSHTTVTHAAGATDSIDVTITMKDSTGATIAAVQDVEVFIAEDAAGATGLTADTFSGALTASTGNILTALTATKHVIATTDVNGVLVLNLVDTGHPADQYFCVKIPSTGKLVVSAASAAHWGA